MNAHRVVIAGGGVGGLEAVLALNELAGDRVAVDLLDPEVSYVQRAQLVAQPFGGPPPQRIDIGELCAGAGARHLRDALLAVDTAAEKVATAAGESLEFDSLLVCVGARAEEAIPGAITFPAPRGGADFERLLERLGHRGSQRIAFAVPAGVEWSMPMYEIAILTAGEVRARRLEGVEITLVTHEPAALQAIGDDATAVIESRLAEAEIRLVTGSAARRFGDGQLELEDSAAIAADAVVALPRLRGPAVPGLPHTADGFIPVDVQMHAGGIANVWAVGDAINQPLKQGGLAAQQAEVAARGIAIRTGARVGHVNFDPVLRAALVTGGPVDYLRRRLATGEGEGARGRALWWPPAKTAGRRLAAFLSLTPGSANRSLVDIDDTVEEADPMRSSNLPGELLLAAADADAEAGDYGGALSWLELVERLDFVIPAAYLARRAEWSRLAGKPREADPATRRLDPTLISADAAISDVRRRVGWLREISRRTGGEMAEQLDQLSADLEDVLKLSKRGKIL